MWDGQSGKLAAAAAAVAASRTAFERWTGVLIASSPCSCMCSMPPLPAQAQRRHTLSRDVRSGLPRASACAFDPSTHHILLHWRHPHTRPTLREIALFSLVFPLYTKDDSRTRMQF